MARLGRCRFAIADVGLYSPSCGVSSVVRYLMRWFSPPADNGLNVADVTYVIEVVC